MKKVNIAKLGPKKIKRGGGGWAWRWWHGRGKIGQKKKRKGVRQLPETIRIQINRSLVGDNHRVGGAHLAQRKKKRKQNRCRTEMEPETEQKQGEEK